ncbi:MAG: tetratricopeptide repeat protein [Saprospiraceae bacterium]|nr:tetratricopeptide repeat protein [Saprospiraceae bacterium]
MSPNSSCATFAEPEKNGEAISFLGETFFRPEDDEATFLHKDSLLQEANTIYQTDTTDLNSIIWYGRRLASMYRFRDAITIFSAGITYHPDAPELYRHRGQMYIITRHPDPAIADFERAANLSSDRMMEAEPDAIPNKLDLPLTNLRFNIYYHLGLAWYLKGDYQKAVEAFSSCVPFAINPDLKVAETYWLYLSFQKIGDTVSAVSLLSPIDPNVEIIENDAYLRSLLMFRSSPDADDLAGTFPDNTTDPIELFGMANWYTWKNKLSEASTIRRKILSTTDWTNVGYIAAEADSSRLLVQ